MVVVDISAAAAAVTPRGSVAAESRPKWTLEEPGGPSKEDYRCVQRCSLAAAGLAMLLRGMPLQLTSTV